MRTLVPILVTLALSAQTTIQPQNNGTILRQQVTGTVGINAMGGLLGRWNPATNTFSIDGSALSVNCSLVALGIAQSFVNPSNKDRYSACGSGATAGERIQTIFASCPLTGCFIDSGGEQSSPVISSASLFSGTAIPITWRLSSATWSLPNGLTVPANVTIEAEEGAILCPSAGKTLTILGPINASLSQHFCLGAGTVSFSGNHQIRAIYPQWFGAKGDGSANETASLTAFFAASVRQPTIFPPGTYFVPDTVDTTIAVGANSATQTVGSTVGMAPGQVLWFGTTHVSRTVFNVIPPTTVVFTASVNSTGGEALNLPGASFLVDASSIYAEGATFSGSPHFHNNGATGGVSWYGGQFDTTTYPFLGNADGPLIQISHDKTSLTNVRFDYTRNYTAIQIGGGGGPACVDDVNIDGLTTTSNGQSHITPTCASNLRVNNWALNGTGGEDGIAVMGLSGPSHDITISNVTAKNTFDILKVVNLDNPITNVALTNWTCTDCSAPVYLQGDIAGGGPAQTMRNINVSHGTVIDLTGTHLVNAVLVTTTAAPIENVTVSDIVGYGQFNNTTSTAAWVRFFGNGAAVLDGFTLSNLRFQTTTTSLIVGTGSTPTAVVVGTSGGAKWKNFKFQDISANGSYFSCLSISGIFFPTEEDLEVSGGHFSGCNSGSPTSAAHFINNRALWNSNVTILGTAQPEITSFATNTPIGISFDEMTKPPGHLYAATYISGIAATGAAGQFCNLSSFNGAGTGATGIVQLTGVNTIASGSLIVVTATGTGYTSAPTSAVASNGSANCVGAAVVVDTSLSNTDYSKAAAGVPYYCYDCLPTTPATQGSALSNGTTCALLPTGVWQCNPYAGTYLLTNYDTANPTTILVRPTAGQGVINPLSFTDSTGANTYSWIDKFGEYTWSILTGVTSQVYARGGGDPVGGVGTTSNHPFVLRANATDVLRSNPDGSVDVLNGALKIGGTSVISSLGKLADAALSSNVPLINAANVFTADQTVQKSAATLTLDATNNGGVPDLILKACTGGGSCAITGELFAANATGVTLKADIGDAMLATAAKTATLVNSTGNLKIPACIEYGATGVTDCTGAGAPAGACVTGSTYRNSTGGALTSFYVCEATVWAAK